METLKKQKAKVGGSGSFFNQLMSNNSSIPEVGKGATEMHHSDRSCYEVIEVSEDGKTVKLEALDAKFDNTKQGGQGHQDWILEPTGRFFSVTWRNNAWRIIGKEIVFEEAFVKECASKGINFIGLHLRKNDPELADKIWGGEVHPKNVVEGCTREKATFNKINILFGVKDYYYDWSF